MPKSYLSASLGYEPCGSDLPPCPPPLMLWGLCSESRPTNLSLSLSASLTVIAVKAVASMITLSAKGKMQLTYPVFYIMIFLMATSCVFQVK